MTDILEVLKNNWQTIIAVFLFILSFILQLIKKKPVNDVQALIYDFACEGIREAEKLIVCANEHTGHLSGKDKLDYVVSYVGSQLLRIFPQLNIRIYREFIINIVEDILDTPQKKEVK